MTTVLLAAASFLVAILASCGSGNKTLNEADPNVVASKPTWAQVEPIIQRDCVPCHSGTEEKSRDREDEDEEEEDEGERDKRARTLGVDPGLESCLSVVNNLDDVSQTIFIDNDMPPGAWPRLTSEEKLLIERWIEGQTPCD